MLKRRYSLIRCREIALCLCLVLIFIYLHMHHASFTAIDSEPSSTVYKVTDEASKASCTVPLKLDTCLAITVEQYERTGNNLVQLITALQLLEACTGIALPKFNIGLRDVFWVPEILGVNGCFQPKDLTIILQKCAKITLGRELFHTRELTTSVLEKTACYQRALMQQASFPPKSNPRQTVIQDVHRLLYRDSFVDGIDFSSTAVAHIRGGDVFKRDYIKAAYYAQPPCSYYYRAFQHSKAAKLLVVTDDDKNPCIQYLADHVPELELLMGTTPTRAFDALRRAPILISTRSTFSQNAISLSLHRKRMVYAPQDTSGEAGPTGPRHGYTKGLHQKRNSNKRLHIVPFGAFPSKWQRYAVCIEAIRTMMGCPCHGKVHSLGVDSNTWLTATAGTTLCTVGFDGSGTYPWTASPEQLSIMLTRDSKLVSCSKR